MAGAPKWAGFSDEQSRALNALVARVDRAVEELKAPDRVLDRRGSSTAVRPRPGDVVRVQAGGVVVLPHPRSAKGRAPIVVLVEGQPVDVLAEAGTVNDEERLTVTTVGAMEWWSTGTEWWGTAVGGSSGGGGTTPLTYGVPVSVGLVNTEGVATSVSRSDHVHRDRIATGAEDGYLSRLVFANASSAAIGTTFGGETVEAAVTWTDETDVPDGAIIGFWGCGAGGGGGSGQGKNDLGAPGGGGGGAAACPPEIRYARADVLAALPITFVCPLGAAGGAGGVGGTFNGNPGAAGGVASAGVLYTAGGGGGANNVTNATAQHGGAGGGALTSGPAGATIAAATNVTGGGPGGSTAAPNDGFGGAGANSVASFHAAYGGASGAVAVDLGVATVAGGSSWRGAGGGGAGGNGGTAGPSVGAPTDGGVGGSITAGGGGAAGTSNVNADGTAGSTGPTGVALVHGGGGGGGGGGSAGGAGGAARTGGAGGAGGFPGGGGGGSGAAVVNSANAKTTLNGGVGGDSVMVVTFYA